MAHLTTDTGQGLARVDPQVRRYMWYPLPRPPTTQATHYPWVFTWVFHLGVCGCEIVLMCQ